MIVRLSVLMLVVPVLTAAAGNSPLSSSFTYQGQLTTAGKAVEGTADLRLTLWDAAAGGTQVGSTLARDAVVVTEGVFTVQLDFGTSAFDGNGRWLEVAVRSPAGAGNFQTLSPRQTVSVTPYALQTRGIFVDDASNVSIGGDGAATLTLRDANGTGTIRMDAATGRTTTKVLEVTGADLAERFPVDQPVVAGMVVEIDPDPRRAGQLRIARHAYSKLVAGIVSGAGNLRAGTILGNLPGNENAPPIALSGRVWTLCDATADPIKPGDLLTTSNTPGHAMKVTDRESGYGAIIGKAMTALPTGKGLVLVLVRPQ